MGKYSEHTDKEMLEARNQEQIRASQIGEYEKLIMLKHNHLDIENDDKDNVVKDLQKIILEVQPDVIYTHNIFDKSKTHSKTCKKVVEAILGLPEESRPRLLYGCEIFRSLDWLPDKYKVVFDLSDNKELQARLIGVYDTRMEQSKNYNKAVVGRKLAHATFGISNDNVDEEKMLWYGINLTPVIQKGIELKEYCTKILNEYNKEMLENI